MCSNKVIAFKALLLPDELEPKKQQPFNKLLYVFVDFSISLLSAIKSIVVSLVNDL